jgi:hypothetical protein
MSDRGTLGLLLAALLCCAAPLFISAGLLGAAWALAREHWGWLAAGLGLAGLAILTGLRRAREP